MAGQAIFMHMIMIVMCVFYVPCPFRNHGDDSSYCGQLDRLGIMMVYCRGGIGHK